jgi:hypothetical protein
MINLYRFKLSVKLRAKIVYFLGHSRVKAAYFFGHSRVKAVNLFTQITDAFLFETVFDKTSPVPAEPRNEYAKSDKNGNKEKRQCHRRQVHHNIIQEIPEGHITNIHPLAETVKLKNI